MDAKVAIDRSLTTRLEQLQEALDILIAKHGAQSETVAIIRERLDEVQVELTDSQVDRSANESHAGDVLQAWGGPKSKDSALMFVLLGGLLIFAFGGMSTMFILMLATKW
ncbi:hypothetical protein ACFL12_06660 [Pseudomonadota bacterium]